MDGLLWGFGNYEVLHLMKIDIERRTYMGFTLIRRDQESRTL